MTSNDSKKRARLSSALDDLGVWKVAEQRVGKCERGRKHLLRKGVVGTDPENLDVQLLELTVLSLPGREVGGSRRAEIVDVELQQDRLLASELA
jgi:hypothetical protein